MIFGLVKIKPSITQSFLHETSFDYLRFRYQNWQLNMFAANPRFARGESRISFDLLKSLRSYGIKFFDFPKQQSLKPKTLN